MGNIFDNEYCHANSIYGTYVKPDEICAGEPDKDNNDLIDGGTDSCQGDSGGPLMCDIDGKAVVTGIVSHGEGCAVEGYPGIYGRVFSYKSWIEKTIADNP